MIPIRRRRLGGAKPFSPADLPGLKVWLKADSLSLANGASVATWTDSSGNGNNVTQATGAKQPTFLTNQLNGMPALQLVAASQQSFASAAFGAALAQPNMIFCVISKASQATNTPQVFVDGLTAGHRNCVFTDNSTLDIGFLSSTVVDSAFEPALNTFVILSALFNGASSQLWQNGASIVTGNTGTNDMTGVSIGIGTGGNAWHNGKNAEVIIVNSQLTTPQQKQVEKYLGNKYGTTVS